MSVCIVWHNCLHPMSVWVLFLVQHRSVSTNVDLEMTLWNYNDESLEKIFCSVLTTGETFRLNELTYHFWV